MNTEETVFVVYVLRSQADQKRYIGMTSDIDRRMREHNQGHTPSTSYRGPFDLIYKEEFRSRAEARQRERYLKSGAGRRFLKSIKK